MKKLTATLALMAALQGFVGGVAVHLVTRALIGDRADALPGGAIGIAVVASPWWISAPAALVGHFASVAATNAASPHGK